jgi:hypothetical protein
MIVTGFYNKGYAYNNCDPYFIDKDELTVQQQQPLTESKSFCIAVDTHACIPGCSCTSLLSEMKEF